MLLAKYCFFHILKNNFITYEYLLFSSAVTYVGYRPNHRIPCSMHLTFWLLYLLRALYNLQMLFTVTSQYRHLCLEYEYLSCCNHSLQNRIVHVGVIIKESLELMTYSCLEIACEKVNSVSCFHWKIHCLWTSALCVV